MTARAGIPTSPESLFPFTSPAEVYAEHVATTVGRDLDIGGLSHAALDRLGPQQWPFVAGATTGTSRLYVDHRFAFEDGKARFVPLSTAQTADAPNAQTPFRLVTGRLRDQWHGMSRTGRIPRLYAHAPEPCVQINPADIARRGWSAGQLLRLSNPRGTIVLPLAASDDVRPGHAFVAMHWGRRSLSHDGVNALMPASYDPVSKQPELKHAAVRIEPAELPWRLTVLRSAGESLDGGEHIERSELVLTWRTRLQPVLGDFAYAALTLDGRERPLLALRLALAAPLAATQLEAIANALDMPEAACLNYRDGARHVAKRAIIEDGRLTGILLAGEEAASAWLRAALRDGVPIDELRRWIFAPRATPPVAAAAPRRVICNCFDVSADEIEREFKAGKTLPEVQEKLKCGTSCGSCLTEVRQMMVASAKA